MNIKNTILMALMVAVFAVALVLVLYVTEAITRENMNEVLVKGGWALLIITVAMVVVGMIKQSSQK